MDTVALAIFSMKRAASILRQIDGLVTELYGTLPDMPDTEAAKLARDAAFDINEVMENVGSDVLANRLDEEAADVKEDIVLYGTRKNPINK